MTDAQSRETLSGLSILVVEDEHLLALDYEATLEEAGGVVLGPAPSEKAALAILETRRPDVALLDLNLDGVRPVALAETLARMSVPFAIVSGYARRMDGEPAFADAPRLTKPVDQRRLLSLIGELAGH